MEKNYCTVCENGMCVNVHIHCKGCNCSAEESKPEVKKYGMRIDKNNPNPETRIVYTDMAVGMKPVKMNFESDTFDYGDWKDVWFVAENKPVMLRSNGNEAYELNPWDYSLKKDGTPSDVANPSFDGNAMSRIPLVWMKIWEEGQYEYYQFSNQKLDEEFHAYAHMREDGTIMDKRYMRMFGGSLKNGKLRSLSGQSLIQSQTANAETTYAKANNVGNSTLWYTGSWSEWSLIELLCILIGKTDNSQEVFGKGHEIGGTPEAENLLTTGIINNKGQFYGRSNSTDQVKVFHMEKPWGGQWERIAGCIYTGSKINVKPCQKYNIDGAGYIDTGITMSGTKGNCISVTKANEYGRFPVVMGGSETTYLCDGGWYSEVQNNYALHGGNSVYGVRCGISCLSLTSTADTTDWSIGAGLSCEQPK